ncbi:MAG TPA: DUF748 domain-containing protein [Syntrophorhabdaceae bacterium]|nr:DUF748 domain-containing protein [Syntrophorhabdaceae bacterium]
MKALKKIIFWCALVFVVLTLFGFFAAPPIAKSILLKQLSATFHRTISIEKIYINPLTLTFRLKGLTVQEKDKSAPFVSFDMLETKFAPSILKGTVALRSIVLKNPYISVVRNEDKSYNFSDILEGLASKEKVENKPAKPSKPFLFSLSDIHIENGSADFTDKPLNKKHEVRDLNIIVPRLSNRPRDVKTDVHPTISLTINGAPYVIEGTTKPFIDSRETHFDIDIKDIDLPYYLAYLPAKLPYAIRSGLLTVKVDLVFIEYPQGREPSLVLTGDLALTKLLVNDSQGGPLVSVPTLTVSLNPVEPFAKKVHLGKVSVQSAQVTVKRDRKGDLNILPASQKQEKNVSEAGRVVKTDARSATKDQALPLELLVDLFELTDGKVTFNDQSLKNPVDIGIDKLTVRGEGLSLAKDSKGKFSTSLLLNKKGQISVDGAVGLTPLTVDAKLSVKNIDIRPFQPYFTDKVKIAVTSGAVNTNGSLALSQKEKQGLTSHFAGGASVTGFKAVDKETGADMFSMESLYLTGIDYKDESASLTIKSVALTNFAAHIAVNPDGTLNLQDVFVKQDGSGGASPAKPTQQPASPKGSPDTKEKPKEQPMAVKIDTVTLQGGAVDFNDHTVTPNFSGQLTEIGGRVSGLSSKVDTLADMELRALYDRFAPLEITGKINPLRDDLYVDLKASFKDMELSPATPYSGKYIGYTVEKGKLSFDVQYLIEKRKLDSKNTIFVDQLTLGNRIESPAATKLPVKLAIALLKDRRGQIKLDIPVTGSLDDPQFSVWRIVLKVIMNLLTKAATAPFALIGSLFGGGEDLGYVEFDPGSATLSDAGLKKVNDLAKALQDRPSLNLDITGHVDIERDRESLKQYLFQKKVKAQKLKELLKKSTTDIAVDDVKVEPKEYEKYLRLAYKAEKFPKPHDIIGLEKTIPVPEMEKLMLTNTPVKDEDLRALAIARATKVKETILKAGQIDAGRLFIIEPKSLAPEKKEKLKDSRVDFTLK